MALISALLTGTAPVWPDDFDPHDRDDFPVFCLSQGVAPLVYHSLRRDKLTEEWPAEVVARLATPWAAAALQETAFREETLALLETLDEAGVRPLLLKGAALSYSLYPAPHLRSRCDTDLLVSREQLPLAAAALLGQGYAKLAAVSGELISFQDSYQKLLAGGFAHVCDLHWEINNALLLRRVFTYHELDALAVPVPGLGPHARGLPPASSFLLACVHRAGHQATNRLIWLYDLVLLAEAMSPAEREWAVTTARDKAVVTICRDAAEAALQRFPSDALGELASLFARVPANDEATARVLEERHRADRIASDLKAAPGFKAKTRLLRELLFPPVDYMRHRFGTRNPLLLAFYYCKRAARGSYRVFKERL